MISSVVRLLILLLLVNIIVGFYVPSGDNRQFHQLLKQRSAENDNEYVWFTRDIHNDEIEQDQLEKHHLFWLNFFKNYFNSRKYPFIENTMYKTK